MRFSWDEPIRLIGAGYWREGRDYYGRGRRVRLRTLMSGQSPRASAQIGVSPAASHRAGRL